MDVAKPRYPTLGLARFSRGVGYPDPCSWDPGFSRRVTMHQVISLVSLLKWFMIILLS